MGVHVTEAARSNLILLMQICACTLLKDDLLTEQRLNCFVRSQTFCHEYASVHWLVKLREEERLIGPIQFIV